MASYTIEDIEMIRRKSGISYEEAVALLDYHNGNVLYALIDLQRNGKLKADGSDQPVEGPVRSSRSQRRKMGLINAFQWLYQTRIKVRRGNTIIVNLSILFTILALFISPKLALAGLIISLLCGYRINLDKNDEEFASQSIEGMVRSAADNVRQSVSGIARSFSQMGETQNAQDGRKAPEGAKEPVAEQPAAPEPMAAAEETPGSIVRDMESYEQGADVPVLQMPVRVNTPDGSVSVSRDNEGYGRATIE